MSFNVVGQLICRRTGAVVVERLLVADRWWTRLRGLQFLRALPPTDGLLLTPCSSIHTCWMRFPINVAFLDATGSIVEQHAAVRPWRVCIPRQQSICAVLEMTASWGDLHVGDRLELHPKDGSRPELQFLSPPPSSARQ